LHPSRKAEALTFDTNARLVAGVFFNAAGALAPLRKYSAVIDIDQCACDPYRFSVAAQAAFIGAPP
jgi:hypothetical protein